MTYSSLQGSISLQDHKYSFFKLIKDSQKSNYKFGIFSWFAFIFVCLASVVFAFKYGAKWEFWLLVIILIFEILLVRALVFYDELVQAPHNTMPLRAEMYSFNQTLRGIIGPLNFIGIILFSMFMLGFSFDSFCFGLLGIVCIYIVGIRPLKEGFAPQWGF